ncbi:MAG: hypothetical protein ACI4QM_04060 [Alphaproteobacteria bacterium]
MNLKQLAILGLAFTTFTTTTQATPQKNTTKPVATLKTNPTTKTGKTNNNSAKKEIKISDETISRVFEAWYPIAQRAEGTFGYAYKDSTGHITCGTGMSEASPFFKQAVFLDAKTHQAISSERRSAYLTKVRSTKGYMAAARLAKNEGIYMTNAEAKRLAFLEIKTVLTEVYSFAQKRKNIDLSTYPIEVQVLVADLVYQVGYPKFEKKWDGFWECLQKKDYKELPSHVQVKDGNISRRAIRDALARIAYAKQTGTDFSKHIKTLKKNNISNASRFMIAANNSVTPPQASLAERTPKTNTRRLTLATQGQRM